MPERIKYRYSDLNRQFMVTLASRQTWTREEEEQAKQKQIEMLYDGVELHWTQKKCTFCSCTGCKRNDHFISLMVPGGKGIPSMYGNHPLNMVHCCRACNNESKKTKVMAENPSIKAYMDYVRSHCPKIPFCERTILATMKEFPECCNRWDAIAMSMPIIPNYITKLVECEDIDSEEEF